MIGARLVLPGRNYEPELLHELIEGERVSVACGVPTMWVVLADWLERTGRGLSTLRLALSSGAAPPRALVERLERVHGVELAQVWGMTEVIGGSLASLKPGSDGLAPEQRLDRRMAAGRTSFGVRYRLVDDDGRELPQDGVAIGHLRVKAPWAASAYLKGESTPALDAHGWLMTGDVASIDADGRIDLKDRAKDIIKSGGEWISSVEIEGVAAGHPEVARAAAIAMAHPKWQERPHLLVQRRDGSTLDEAALIEFLRGRLPGWWLPDRISFVADIPLTPAGKIDKRAVRSAAALIA